MTENIYVKNIIWELKFLPDGCAEVVKVFLPFHIKNLHAIRHNIFM